MSTTPSDSTASCSTPGVFRGVPSFIRAQCRTASRGGQAGYIEAGSQLGRSVRGLQPLDLEEEQWLDILDAELAPLLDGHDDATLLAWLASRYPRIMELVPSRRRASFAAGFRCGFDAED